MLTGFRRFQLTALAIELQLPQHLAAGARTSEELSRVTGFGEDRLRRMLRGMTWAGLLRGSAAGAYEVTELGRLLIAEGPRTIHSFFRINSKIYYHGWGALHDYLATGAIPFEHFNGEPVFDFMNRDPELRELFHGEMTSATGADAESIVAGYAFPEVGTFVDIGGGFGQLAVKILQKRPGLRGIVFDLPALREDAEDYIRCSGLGDRCRFQAGDIFAAIAPEEAADLFLLKWVLHDWNDDECVRILQHARMAMAMTGGNRLLVIERLMPEHTTTGEDIVQRDLNMLVLNGGQERTLKEYEVLLQAGGLQLGQVTTVANGFSIMEAVISPKG